MKLIYFAWLRERIGRGEEMIVLAPGIKTIGDLVSWLRTRGEGYASAFAQPDIVRAAVDRRHCRPDTPLAGAREIAFFPPMTGG
ncbi:MULTISPECIES: molybdopterin converting factor subunit 1 [unclassified Chelatococcus]|uniref:molybdopterin converting factor subunit 1 n=1 Tax=unclassified Chelatococcus TaxID=2638111 RepID=UPI001BD0D6B3|nr:molybdopterin converting factor subunit 1 [Chelatococcus sp.]MBS7697764.1 molybdopterin converting factor subunit 1 [Chelatococcus sp. YT9]MBX3558379.1 molybdopterin converting factor subunit 1 [Chelatococcus sp.]